MNKRITIISITIFLHMHESQYYLRFGKGQYAMFYQDKKIALLAREVLTQLDKVFQENLNEKIATQGKKIHKRNLPNEKITKPISVMVRRRYSVKDLLLPNW